MLVEDLSTLEVELQSQLSCLLAVSFPRSQERTEFDRKMVQTIRDVFEQHLPALHLIDP